MTIDQKKQLWTAIGKRFAPFNANIFMVKWEEKALQKCKIKNL